MKPAARCWLLVAGCLGFLLATSDWRPATVFAAQELEEKEEPYEVVVKTWKGLHFNVPPDWPIEERNNVVAPIPIEEYLAKKFSAMENRLEALGRQMQTLEQRVSDLGSSGKGKGSSLQSGEIRPPTWDLEADFEDLDAEVGDPTPWKIELRGKR